MAGGDSPRQKMINMMYIVLIAMLALNVDTKVLKKFIMINNSFESTNSEKVVDNSRKIESIKAAVEANAQVKDLVTVTIDGSSLLFKPAKTGDDITAIIENPGVDIFSTAGTVTATNNNQSVLIKNNLGQTTDYTYNLRHFDDISGIDDFTIQVSDRSSNTSSGFLRLSSALATNSNTTIELDATSNRSDKIMIETDANKYKAVTSSTIDASVNSPFTTSNEWVDHGLGFGLPKSHQIILFLSLTKKVLT